MAANSAPIFSRVGDIQGGGPLTTASNTYDGTAAANTLVFTADATNGGYVQRLRFKATGTNTATVARVYINNGSTNGTAANNRFYGEVSLPAITATSTSATVDIDYPLNIALPPGYRIYVGLASNTATFTGWYVTVIAGAY